MAAVVVNEEGATCLDLGLIVEDAHDVVEAELGEGPGQAEEELVQVAQQKGAEQAGLEAVVHQAGQVLEAGGEEEVELAEGGEGAREGEEGGGRGGSQLKERGGGGLAVAPCLSPSSWSTSHHVMTWQWWVGGT